MLQRSRFQQNQEFTSFSNSIAFMEDVSVSFGATQALKSIQLTVERGEIIFVTGASGAGKTTLLKVLAGEEIACSGRIILSGQHRIARVFQDLRLIERYSCEDNLMISYDPSRYRNRNQFVNDMKELSRILGIEDRLKLKVREANGGLRQKVAIIRALLSGPDLFIADEPTSSLDVHNAKKLFDLLNIYAVKRGMTVIWASHNSELVRRFSGRIVHLDSGRLVYSGHACFI